ncbi:MAG: hypothetical protein AB7I01_13765 [Gammaproteobacteria bacterium]
MLDGLEIETIGPIGTVEDALQLAVEERVHFAVLDINLHGDKVFPVADLLT